MMNRLDFLVESRIIGVSIGETGKEVDITFVGTDGHRYLLSIGGVDRLLVSELREQNVVEEITHWKCVQNGGEIREQVFLLVAGCPERYCDVNIVPIVERKIHQVLSERLELMEITAIAGASVLITFVSLKVHRITESSST
jgi:hypothetical protein